MLLGSSSYMDLRVQSASALLHTIYFLHEGSMYAKYCVPQNIPGQSKTGSTRTNEPDPRVSQDLLLTTQNALRGPEESIGHRRGTDSATGKRS